MIISVIRTEDLDTIEMLNKLQDFKLKNLSNCIIDRIVYEDDKTPIAYGIVKRMAEAILLVNPEISIITRAKAMRELMKYAEFGATREGCQQLHCFVHKEELAESLEEHFGFVRSKDIVMVKEL